MDKTLYFDGTKSIPLSALPAEAWTYVTGGDASGDLRDAYKQVPWLFRGVELRSQSVASLPFGIFDGDKEIDSSKDWQNAVKFLADPQSLLYQLEASLTLKNRAYLFRSRNLTRTLDVRYLAPPTVTPVIDPTFGLVGFKRTVNGEIKPFTLEDIIYFWKPSAFVEVGPSDDSPARAALNAANVILNLDKFVTLFFARGAIKATLLTVEGNPAAPEKEKLKQWWNRFFSGIKQAWQTEVVSAAVKPVVVGEGVSELENETLTNSKRQDIATALGIPQTKLFSDSASGLGGGGVVEQDDLRFLNDTVIPEANFIQNILNTQLFRPLGLQFRFKPETLDAFQEDEAQRASSLSSLVSAINSAADPDTLRAAMQLLGYEIPAELEPLLFKPRAPKPQTMYWSANGAPVPRDASANPDTNVNADAQPSKSVSINDLDKWQRKALKRVKEGRGAACEFESDAIRPALRASIAGALEQAHDANAVRAVFANAMQWQGYP